MPTSWLLSAGIMGGLGDLIDFLLPLWAGMALGLSPTMIGIILAIELVVAVALRPLAGRAVDCGAGAALAAGGAIVYAGGMMLIALAQDQSLLLVSAVLLGSGSSFFWVPLRALVAEKSDVHASFSALTSAEGTGVWIAYVLALSLLPELDYRGVLGLGAGAAALAAVFILVAFRTENFRSHRSMTGTTVVADERFKRGFVAQRKRLMAMVMLVSLVEAAASIYLLLKLQQTFGLDIMQIVWIYFPGLVVYSIAPATGQPIVRMLGERAAVVLCLLLSAGGILLVTLADRDVVLAVGWAMVCWSWGWLNPVQQATTVRIHPGMVGRAMGRYESWTLIGGAAGAFCGGFALDVNSPGWVAVAAVTVCLVCLAIVPGLYRRRVRPRQVPKFLSDPPANDEEIMPPEQEAAQGFQDTTSGARPHMVSKSGLPSGRRISARNALIHAAAYGLAQIPLVLVDLSWSRDMVASGSFVWGREIHADTLSNAVYTGNMVWGALVLLDLTWSMISSASTARRSRRESV